MTAIRRKSSTEFALEVKSAHWLIPTAASKHSKPAMLTTSHCPHHLDRTALTTTPSTSSTLSDDNETDDANEVVIGSVPQGRFTSYSH